jgi:gamma-glutamyltranspeptidase/glutathione hydrolase
MRRGSAGRTRALSIALLTLVGAGTIAGTASGGSYWGYTARPSSAPPAWGSLGKSLTTSAYTYRLNVGGPAYTDTAGHKWLADTGATGGTKAASGRKDAGVADATIFNDERWGMTAYTAPVPKAGTYQVTLYFAENYHPKVGQRVFSVTAEGKAFVTNLDLDKTAGFAKAYSVTKPVTTKSTTLHLAFSSTVDFATLSALQVTTASNVVNSPIMPVEPTTPDIPVTPAQGPVTPVQPPVTPTQPPVTPAQPPTAPPGTPTGPTLVNQTLPGKQVWAHIIPQGLPNWSQGSDGNNQYGELYPLDLVNGNYFTPARPTSGVPRAQAAGLTGVEILQFSGNVGSDFVTDWFKQADPTWSDSDPNNNFSVAPCLAISSSVDDAVRLVTQYSAAAAGHASAARVNGKLVVYVYGSQEMPASGWASVRSQLAAAGVSVFLVADLGEDAAARPYSQRSAPITALFPYFDASYTFDWTPASSWADLVGFLNSSNRQYAGGMMPGYDRETSADGPYYDASGTKVYRQQWEQNLASGANWQTVSTWNDMVERTEVQATSSWNNTRSDITAFYSAKFRGIPFPKPSAQLYATTPEYVRVGEAPQAEALILNGSTDAATVTVQLVDGNGQPYGDAVTSTVAAGTAGDATTPSTLTVTTMPAGHFLRAKTSSYDSTGALLQTVTSAPIVVYGTSDVPTPNLRRLYYSIPAYAALPGNVQLAMNGDPTTGTATASVTAPAGVTVRFNEVLQNTRQAVNGFDTAQLTTSVPMAPRTIIGGEQISASSHGFYVGRIIDSQERVGYSDPIYVP